VTSLPFQSHSDTSLEAAESMEPKAGTLRWAVLWYLRDFGPATDERMQDVLQMPASTQRPRRVELVRAGFVYDTGRRALTRSGRHAVLWDVYRVAINQTLF
jgi:hypothetical protein